MVGQPRRPNTIGGVRGRPRPQQTPAAEPDARSYVKKFSCSTHYIEYHVAEGDRAQCPMCVLERDYDEARAQLLVRDQELNAARGQLERFRVQVDLLSAIRAAFAILGDDDYAWLKVQMYQYKIDKSVMLKATHGRLHGGQRIKRGDKLPVNGFMTVPRHGDPEAHLATSFGGLAIAEYLDEAVTCLGVSQAMGLMLKAWWKALPGGQS